MFSSLKHRWLQTIFDILFRPFGFFSPIKNKFDLAIIWPWAHVMNVIPETHLGTNFDINIYIVVI